MQYVTILLLLHKNVLFPIRLVKTCQVYTTFYSPLSVLLREFNYGRIYGWKKWTYINYVTEGKRKYGLPEVKQALRYSEKKNLKRQETKEN